MRAFVAGVRRDVCDVTSSPGESEVIMRHTHAPHRTGRGLRRRAASRFPLAVATPSARLCAALAPAALLLLAAAPAAALRPEIYCAPISSVSTGDPDDGEHRDLPPVKTIVAVTESLPEASPLAATERSFPSPAFTRGSLDRMPSIRRAGPFGLMPLWSLLRLWFLHR